MKVTADETDSYNFFWRWPMPQDDKNEEKVISSPMPGAPQEIEAAGEVARKTPCPSCGDTGDSTFAPGSKCMCGA